MRSKSEFGSSRRLGYQVASGGSSLWKKIATATFGMIAQALISSNGGKVRSACGKWRGKRPQKYRKPSGGSGMS